MFPTRWWHRGVLTRGLRWSHYLLFLGVARTLCFPQGQAHLLRVLPPGGSCPRQVKTMSLSRWGSPIQQTRPLRLWPALGRAKGRAKGGLLCVAVVAVVAKSKRIEINVTVVVKDA